MGILGVAHAVVRPDRLRRAWVWAAQQPPGPSGRRSLVVALFRNHGRFLARGALVGMRDPHTTRRGRVIVGVEHLAGVRQGTGALLLGFHLGPPCIWLPLQLSGFRVTFLGRPEASSRRARPGWPSWLDSQSTVSITGSSPETRVLGLHRGLRLLRQGEHVCITADGPVGVEAFRIPLPGGPAIIRSGWLALRRHAEAPTLPVLSHLEGRREIVTIHPPLPDPQPDPARDALACRDVLSPLLQGYVRRFPEQCRSLAFWS